MSGQGNAVARFADDKGVIAACARRAGVQRLDADVLFGEPATRGGEEAHLIGRLHPYQ